MTDHHLSAAPAHLHWGAFDAALPPVFEIASGDRITIDTISGGPEQVPDGDFEMLAEHAAYIETATPILPGHIMTGPIAVRGATAGQVLEVRVLEAELRQDWAWNMIAPLRGSLPEDFPDRRLLLVELDRARNVACLPWGAELPLSPFFGVMGVAPPANWGAITSIVPRAHGGNLDIKELGPGATLYLPIFNDGALFSVGDGHAVQGDGEVCLSAAETALTGTFELVVRDDMALTTPRAETPTHYITIGVDPDLDDAAKHALRDMIALIQQRANLSAEDAYTLCSLAADVHVSQLVNQNKGIHVMLPKSALHG